MVTADGPTVAVRVPDFPELQKLVLDAGHPLVSTSANLSGQAPVADPAGAAEVFGERIDGWWAEPGTGGGRPSALVDLTHRPVSPVREGPVPWPADLDPDSTEK